MSLKNKTVAILVEELYQDLEVWYPFFRLKEEGANVIVVGTGSRNVYKSKHGYEIKVDMSASKLNAKDFDGVIIPGGYAPDYLRRYSEVNDFVRKMYERGKVISSICHGAWVLCSAGIVKRKTITCFSAIKDDVKNAGAKYVDREVVVDGNLITSRKPEDLPAFLRETIRALKRGVN